MIVVISGTDRPGSQTRKIAGLVMNHLKSANVEHSLIDLRDLPEGLFSGNHYSEKPPGLEPFQEQILTAAGLITVVPEYNGSFPGALKYFIDMLRFPESLRGLPCTFVGVAAGYFGALRAIEQLAMIYQYREAHIFAKRVMFPAVEKLVNAEFTEITDDFVKQLFVACLDEFVEFASRLKSSV